MKRFVLALMVLGLLAATPEMASAFHVRNHCVGNQNCNTFGGGDGGDATATVTNSNTNVGIQSLSNTNNLSNNQGQGQEQEQEQYQGQFQIGINKQNQSQIGINEQGQSQNNRQVINPKQTVTFVSPREYLAAPGLTVAPGATRPYNPESWIHGPGLLLPTHMTFVQADSCRASGISDDWDGNSLADEASEITLWYPNLKVGEAFPVRFNHYLGTAMSETDSDHAFVTAVCEAAYRAMEEGADMGMVTFKIRPRSKSWGVGLPASGAASSTGGLAGTAGMALGVSNAYVKGDLFVHITSFTRDPLVFTGK